MRIFLVAKKLLVQRDAIFVGKNESGAARVFAGDGTHRENLYGSAVTSAIEHSADFDSAARKALESFGDFMTNLLDHHERVLDDDRTFRNAPQPEFRIAHARSIAGTWRRLHRQYRCRRFRAGDSSMSPLPSRPRSAAR